MSNIVIHPEGTDGGTFTICGGNPGGQAAGPAWFLQPHCATCTCQRSAPRSPDHGTWVTCRCGRTGIEPDPGHEADFMPPGSTQDGNTITLRFGGRP
jgi:hypothetical protein